MLEEGVRWSDGTIDPVIVDWEITPGSVAIPTPKFESVVYDGASHTVVDSSTKYAFINSSVTTATDADEYQYTADLVDKVNWRWSDGSTTNQTFTWKILPGTVQMPTPLFESVVYDGENHIVTTNSTLFDFAAGSVTSATNAGFYNYTVSLHDGANWRWADGSDTNLVYNWSIARLPIARPPIPGDDGVFVYDGHEKIAATNSIYYSFTGSTHGTDVANYSFTAQLNNNWCWNDGEPLEDYTVDWRIEQAPNEITYLKLDSWKLGTPAKNPVCQALFGQATAIFSYCAATGGEWSAEKPTTNGVFLVKAVIPETTNYSAAEKTARFLVYKSFEDLYSDWVEITFPNYQGDALYDYPVLIAISEQAYPGFSYARAGDKDSIAFMDFTPDLQQQPLSFEVDTWNPGGTSLIWVKIPRLYSKEGYAKTTIRMYWHLKEGAEAPGPDPADVWLGYSGVWHFAEEVSAEQAGIVRAADSTGNRNEGIPETGSKGNITQMISVDGQIGISRQISSFSVASAGNRLVVSNFANVALGPGFIFSGWVRFGSYTGAPAIFSRKLRGKEGGFEMASDSTNRQKLDLYGRGESGKATGNIGGAAIAGHWEYITFAASGDKYWLWVKSPTNGNYEEADTLLSPVGDDLEVLAFGADPTGAVASVYGSIDEFRIKPWNLATVGEPTEADLKKITSEGAASYANETAAGNFVSHDFIVVEGVKQNYWITEPSLTKTAWEASAPPEERGQAKLGQPAIGTVNYVCHELFSDRLTITNDLPTVAGRYKITFSVEEPGFNVITKEIYFSVLDHADYPSPGATEDGRILLGNDDSMGDWGDSSVTNQAYWLAQYIDKTCSSNTVTRKRIGGEWVYVTNWFYWVETTTNATYWTHSGVMDRVAAYPYLLPGSVHTLETTNNTAGTCGSPLLWRLNDVRIGNLWKADFRDLGAYSYLPWSPTSCANSSNGVAFTQSEVGNLVIRNSTETDDGLATGIYSPCYTNGIGTIYFDAVNFNADFKSTTDPDSAANYRLVVEVATNVIGSAAIPTDENVFEVLVVTNILDDVGEVETYVTNLYGKANWQRVPIEWQKWVGGAIAESSKGEVLELAMENGGTHQNFYRVHVQLNWSVPMRFRIRRDSCHPDKLHVPDSAGQILMDNLIVSAPRMRADMTAFGAYDREKAGPNVLGYECATSVPYPAITDKEVLGRARPIYSTSGDSGANTNAFITGVTMYYRWRYLNQRPDNLNVWSSVDMHKVGDMIEAVSPLVFPEAEGDVEWWYETYLQAPYYQYVDYSGTGRGVPGFTEELACVTNRLSGTQDLAAAQVGGRLPSLGTDWFFRLRNGKDDCAQAVLVINEGPLANEYPMYVSEDHAWRCMVPVPSATNGTCKFYFELRDQQVPGATAPESNKQEFSPDGVVPSFPAKGKLIEGAVPAEFTIDHAATHLEFRFSDTYRTYAITRAEYQTFNEWNDAHSKVNPSTQKAEFFANYTMTNGVNVVDMKKYTANIPTWKLYEPASEQWNEPFYLPADAYDEDYGFKREEIFPSHATPNGWGGDYIAFVQEKLGGSLVKTNGVYHPYPHDSGMAGKLLGQSKGSLSFMLNDPPNGVERLTYRARVGQSLELDNFAWSTTKLFERNYMFTTLANMSHMIGTSTGAVDDNIEHDMAAGGTMSMIAYYFPNVGFYEFRVERIEQGARVMMSLWKWHNVNGAMKADCLVKRRMESGVKLWTPNTVWRQGETSNTVRTEDNADIGDRGPKNPQYRLMFITVKNESTSTKIYGGISYGVKLPYSAATTENNFNTLSYSGLYFEDAESDRHTFGSYGVAAKDCPAEFLKPKHGSCDKMVANLPVSSSTILRALDGEVLVARDKSKGRWFRTNETNGRDIGAALADLTSDEPDLFDAEFGSRWALPINRIEPYVNTNWTRKSTMATTHRGLHIPVGLEQKVIVQMAPKERPNNWETIGTNTVSGYGFTPYELSLYRKGEYNVRFTTGEQAIDVVVDDVKQTQWMGEDGTDSGASITYASDRFIYTQGHVVTNAERKCIEVELVPSRAHAERPLSIRSPLIDGLGKISFNYEDAAPETEIWVQMATNAVSGNLSGGGGYNESVKSVENGQQQQVGEWITLAKYTYLNADPELALYNAETRKPAGTKTVYVGLHDQKNVRPIQGVFRLFVPTNVVAATDAMTPAQLDAGGKDHGRITVTGVTVWDEPGLNDRSWRGWNLRTIGDEKDSEKRMYLSDMTIPGAAGYGLVCALNNSINDVVTDDIGKVRTSKPTIWSPTLGTFTQANGNVVQGAVGEVTFKARLYGAGVEKAPAVVSLWGASNSVVGKWTKIETFEVTEPYLQNFQWKAGGESYAAVKFVFESDKSTSTTPDRDRVILEEVTICERVNPTLSFLYAWPFRDGLGTSAPIENIGDPSQQPLAGENWGFQTKLSLQQLGDEIDLGRGLEVSLCYFDSGAANKQKSDTWGYEQWMDKPTGELRLEFVGDESNLVFRSVGSSPASVLPPFQEANTVVQFMLKVKYWDKGGVEYNDQMHTWERPSWYHPVDYNAELGGFAGYTILDRISPGRAWINEVQWNNARMKYPGTSKTVTDNQFIEVCIPSGVDMTGWQLKVRNQKMQTWTMATFGSSKVAAQKTSGSAVNGYEFFLIESPATNLKGLLWPDGTLAQSDGVWNSDSATSISGGTLNYAYPYGFELVRPSGVVEHAFTLDGTNEWAGIDFTYDATNLLARLNAQDGSPNRFYAGIETEKNKLGTTFGSAGVVRGEGNREQGRGNREEGTGNGEEGRGNGEQGRGNGPGSEGTWESGLDFTPGGLNPGQVIPAGWFLAPNGTNTWVYFSVSGGHLAQSIGGDTNRTVLVILPQGVTTNVIYTAAPWYEVSSIAVNGVSNAVHRPGTWAYPFSVPEGAGSTVNVVAQEGVDERLMADKFGLKGQRYANAVVRWLQDRWPDKSPDEIRFARYGHLKTFPATRLMTLVEMYWLDIPPFNTEGSAFEPAEGMDLLSSEWVFRGGFTDYAPHSVIRQKNWGKVTNSVFKVKLMITNEWDNTAYAPQTLQGLNYEQSAAGNYSGGWTSVAFRIYGMLDVNSEGGFNQGFKPFREFMFYPGSFGAAGSGEGTRTAGGVPGEPGEFETVIELLDPFSKGSIGYEYGWWRHPNNTPAFFKWQIDSTNNTPVTVEMLQKKSTYGE